MIKLNRTTEYGLIALRHISRKPHTITSAREVADCYGLPFEITAKTLQKLRDSGLIQSAQGARGGYTLQRNLSEVSLADFLKLMEGPQAVVACATQTATPAPRSAAADLVQLSSFASSTTHPGGAPASEKAKSDPCQCDYLAKCEIKSVMNNLNHRVHEFLSNITLAELATVSVKSEPAASSQTSADPAIATLGVSPQTLASDFKGKF